MFKFNNEVLTIKGQPVMVTRKKKRATNGDTVAGKSFDTNIGQQTNR